MKKQAFYNAQLVFCVALIVLPSLAWAGPIEDGVDWVLDLLTNGIARSLAIIAIIIAGFMAYFGKLTGERAMYIALGIVLVFGAAALVDAISTAVSASAS